LQRGSTDMDSESERIRLDGISFSKPFPIDEWDPPKKAALYLILRKDDGMIIYVGESGNLEDREFWKGHNKYNCWVRVAGAEKNLAIAFYPMVDSTPIQRKEVESNLVRKLQPLCADPSRVLGPF
jgi:hypothetical protein